MSSEQTYFPQQFLDKYSALLGTEWNTFFETIKTKQPKSFWVNTNKTTPQKVVESLTKKGVQFGQYAFDKRAFYINLEKPGDLSEFTSGEISLQEKAAMLPVVALAPKETDYVLDACAAPGMKTIQLSNFMNNKWKILACEVNSERIKSLEFNVKKYGLSNVETKRIDFRNLQAKFKEKFNKILLDAPCSSEGLVRKSRVALEGWSQKLVERKAQNQKELLLSAFSLLKKGGEMVYSTCSFAPEENEEVVLKLLDTFKTSEVLKIEIPGIKIRENKLCKNCVRLYPQDNDTQQFFLAKIRKN
jgi:NOL1/NOP2/sun family putative RNA methylase